MNEALDRFKKALSRTPLMGERSYKRTTLRGNPVHDDFDLDQIEEIIRAGNPESLRDLSQYYYRTSGVYRNAIDLQANLFLYDTVVTPIYDTKKSLSKEKLVKDFYSTCGFVEALNVPINFARISREILMNGVYFGLLRQEGDKFTIQDLPVNFCRTRFKTSDNLDILEFNIHYFYKIFEKAYRDEAVRAFPPVIRRAWYSGYGNNSAASVADFWVEIPPEMGGIVFSIGDKTPPYIAAIPAIYKQKEAVEREAQRDQNELYKILTQKMPITSKGDLVFQLDEVADIHEAVSEMLKNTDTLDVLTTFGDVKLESVQDSSAASQSSDRIEKYKTNSFDELGMAAILFNSDGSSSLPYSIKKNEAQMQNVINQYACWIRFLVNARPHYSRVSYDFAILPTTIYNRKELQSQYFQGAQYGYSKMYAGVASGIKQINQISLMNFENDILEMTDKMVPLQSSYTSSGNSEKKVSDSVESNDINSDGGNAKQLEEQSEKTVQNNEGQEE